jgi:undecaprenyl-diphosphatase
MQALDWSLFHVVNSLAGHSRVLDAFFALCAQGLAYLLVLMVATLWVTPAESERSTLRRQQIVIYAVAAALLALGINQLIGLAWFRPRPFASHHVTLLLPRSTDASFPSDHAAGGFALTVTVLLARDRWARRLGWLMLALAALLAFARVFVGTHYPFDVLAGALIGAGCAACMWLLAPHVDTLVSTLLLPSHRLTALILRRLGDRTWRVPAQ